jgi:dTDP-glucose pyrophosphorylase
MKNWRDAVVRPSSNIRDTLRALDKGAQNIALVCDDSDRLLAVVSDGDIRRGLLSELHMDDPVSAVANTKPKVAQQGVTREKLKEILAKEGLNVLPIVDQENKVVALHTLASLEERPELLNPVFIMAGGFGTRLKPLTDNCPKPMLPIGDKPILQHTIERLRKQGFRNFFISTHYLPDQIIDHFGDGTEHGVNIIYLHEEQPLGTGGALGLLPSDIIEKPLILLNGDILTDLDFVKVLESHDSKVSDATMCLREQETSLAYGVVEVAGGKVTAMVEKPIYRHLINTGIYVLSNSCVNSVQKGARIDLPSLLERRIKEGYQVNAYTYYGKWIDIGQMSDYIRAQDEIMTLS